MKKYNWRNESSISYVKSYNKKFAWFPIRVNGSHKVWLTRFYFCKIYYYYHDEVIPFRVESAWRPGDHHLSETEFIILTLQGKMVPCDGDRFILSE